MTNLTWDEYYLLMSEMVAQKSKDPSTKVGAVIVSSENTILSTGFNGFPRGVRDISERYNDRPMKYSLVSHAERNAIDFCAVRPKGATLYSNRPFVCKECAKSIVQSGISRVVLDSSKGFGSGNTNAWKDDQIATTIILSEANVSLEIVCLKDIGLSLEIKRE